MSLKKIERKMSLSKKGGRHLDSAEYWTKKGKGDNRTLTVGVRQVQKHSYEVRFCPSYLLDTLLCSESGKRSLFLPKWSKLRLCTVSRRRSLQMKMRLGNLGYYESLSSNVWMAAHENSPLVCFSPICDL